VFGQQETSWKTERRPSKNGSGYTTWILIIETGALQPTLSAHKSGDQRG
jgi:hypothetical protein